MYLAIDPGVDTGWSLWRSREELVACGCSDPRIKVTGKITHMLLEMPMVYRARLMKGNPNNIVTLALQCGRYAEHFESRGAHLAMVHPHDWKGNLPKDIHHARIWGELSPSQLATASKCGDLVPASKRHNMMDALALGLWAWQRNGWTTEHDVSDLRPRHSGR